ncbi:MAG: ATPase, partial [Candidatus Diapherotrites archaeon]|nr:ATPase [Candidatus Diapherotrites archaeon]
SMGIKGTDVAKGASDMILRDDNFATIVSSVEDGRGIYGNIRKFVRFLVSANFDELAVISTSVIAGFPAPFVAVQILWINLLTDGLPALALGVDPPDEDVMHKPPRDPKEGIISGMLGFFVVSSVVATVIALGLFFMYYDGTEGTLLKARTMVFTGAVFFELFLVFNCRSDDKGVFEMNALSNKWLIIAVVISIILQFAVIYHPGLQVAFQTTALDLNDWALILAMSGTALLISPRIFAKSKVVT